METENGPAVVDIMLNLEENSREFPLPPAEPHAAAKCGIFVVAENRLLCDLLCELVAAQPGFTLLGLGATPDPALAARMAEAGDAIGVFFLPHVSTSEQFMAHFGPLRNACPQLRPVLVGMPSDPQVFLAAVASGVAAYLTEDASTEEVLAALVSVARGEVACPRRLLPWLFRSIAERNPMLGGQCAPNPFGLSRREGELLPLVARGWTNKQIASELHLSEQTVKNHLRRMLRKVGAANRVAMVERCRYAAGL